jgi:hypothetical protein
MPTGVWRPSPLIEGEGVTTVDVAHDTTVKPNELPYPKQHQFTACHLGTFTFPNTVVLMFAIKVITTHPTAMIYHRTIYVTLIQSLHLSHFPLVPHTEH